jgi:mRNA-degrading endonuclease toxin of MazEF toxin-antitoxin module
MTFPHRGDLYLVEFDPARGHEIQKTRPALIIDRRGHHLEVIAHAIPS